ncbi:MAG: hypothetical protein AAGH57_10360 [Pseudomonadota bacterium]
MRVILASCALALAAPAFGQEAAGDTAPDGTVPSRLLSLSGLLLTAEGVEADN